MDTKFFQIECKAVQEKDGVKIKGYASTPHIDRYDDIVDPNAFKNGLENFLKNPVMLRSHNADKVIGKFYTDGEDAPVLSNEGLSVTGLITDELTGKQALNGEMRAMSIGFIPKDISWEYVGTGKFFQGQELQKEIRIIKDMDLIEISIVSTPANPNALFTVEKSVKSYLQSLPNSIMQKKCSVYPDLEAKYKLGDRYLSQKAIDDMDLKGDEVLEPVEQEVVDTTDTTEAKEVESETTLSENNETSGETPQEQEAEEASAEVVEEEQEQAPETKGLHSIADTKAMEKVIEVLDTMVQKMNKQDEVIASLKSALESVELQKSKTLFGLTADKSVSQNTSDATGEFLKKALLEAKDKTY